jgi:sugar phosphate isomerase/epimerase
MSQRYISRRDLVGAAGLAAGALLAGGRISAVAGAQALPTGDGSRFRYCLNTSTIRGQKLGLAREIDVAAEAGYDAIEPWVSSLQEYTRSGGTLRDIRKRIEDKGLTVESAISFPRWIVDDDAIRAEAVEQVKREMDLLAQIGGKRIAAPPAGATDGAELDLLKAAERYRALLELGDQTGVVPQVEVWGPSKNLHRLGQSMFVVIESGHPKACLLPDVYHTYKGGSDFHGFKTISSRTIQVFHLNDYPASPPRETIRDADRIMPGDGIAPLTLILRDLCDNGSEAVLSLELFSQVYWDKDPLAVAREGLAKMKAAVQAAA